MSERVYANGIRGERPALKSIRWKRKRCEVAELRRNGAGHWTVILDADFEAVLPDGRVVRCLGELRCSGRQRGRKPNGGQS